MRNKILLYLSKIDNWLYLILIFCLIGCVRNILVLKYVGLNYTYFIVEVSIAMLTIFFTQSLLILLRQRIVWLISLLQCIFSLFVSKDFTFTPLASEIIIPIKNILFKDLSYGEEYFISFAIVSFLFCAEIIKTYLLYTLTDQLVLSKKVLKEDK